MTRIDRDQLKQMLDENSVTLVEVLDPEHFDDFHLPGAVNVPIHGDFTEEIRRVVPDRHQPVVVYCYDTDCDASAQAASRMDELGYDRVYDYEAGKVDWKQADLPIEE